MCFEHVDVNSTPWQCAHGVCDGCCYNIFVRNPSGTCPLCRSPTAHFYATTFTGVDGFVMVSDCGAALRGTHAAERVVSDTMPPTNRSAWLNAGACLAVRMDSDGHLLYTAIGTATDTFMELFAAVPRFSGTTDGPNARQGRVDRRNLTRLLTGFMTHDENENVLEFLRTAAFPVRLTFDDETT